MRAPYNDGMSVADGMPPAISLPADPSFKEGRDREEGSKHLRRGAIAAALLAHAAVIAALIVQWPNLFPAKPLEHPPIPITLVTQVPPPQAKPAPPPPPPPPQQQQQQERVSGADTKTTAPPPEADKGEEAAPKPTPPPPAETQPKATEAQPKPTPPQEEKTKQEKPKLAKRETTLKPSRGAVNRAPGERETEGDPYLNALFAMIQSHRFYPPNAVGSLGLPLDGTAVYLIKIRADGALMDVALARSSGADVLDKAALTMIKRAAPFPAPPQSEFPGPSVVLEVTIHLFPGMG
jgi:periplasmic protein TonB